METNPWAPGKPSASTQKIAESERIARQTAEFIKRGGKISQYPSGFTNFTPAHTTPRVKRAEQ